MYIKSSGKSRICGGGNCQMLIIGDRLIIDLTYPHLGPTNSAVFHALAIYNLQGSSVAHMTRDSLHWLVQQLVNCSQSIH